MSGGFDPVHVGHQRMFKAARELGNYLVVILNSDRFLMEKKGYVFMPYEERAELLCGFQAVDEVMRCIDDDQTVCETLRALKPTTFANGGDRKADNIPEYAVCQELGIEMVFNVGGEKVQSSSELVAKAK